MSEEEITMPAALGERIRDARRIQNMTQGELAGTDYSVSYISAIERSKIRPSLRALAWLASRLNVNLGDLLTGSSPIAHEIINAVIVEEDAIQYALMHAQLSLATHQYTDARDTLLAVRENTKVLSQRIRLNLLLGEAFVALQSGNEAKEALELNLMLTKDIEPITEEYTRNILGLAYNILQMHMLAAECHRQCLIAIDSDIVRDPSFELSVLNNLGTDYMLLGHHAQAIIIFKRAFELGKTLLSPQTLAELYWKISDEYRHEGILPQSLRYADLANEHLRHAGNQRVFARIQSSLGLAYAEQNENDMAEEILQEAQQLAGRIGDVTSQSLALTSLARVQLSRGDAKLSLTSAQQALQSAEASNDNEALGRAYLALGEAFSATQSVAEADDMFVKGLAIMEKSGSQTDLSHAYERYADLLEQRGDVKKALDFLRKSRVSSTSNSR